jgi:hypothetical protein
MLFGELSLVQPLKANALAILEAVTSTSNSSQKSVATVWVVPYYSRKYRLSCNIVLGYQFRLILQCNCLLESSRYVGISLTWKCFYHLQVVDDQ